MKMQPLVFIITLNWNGREWLGDCYNSVFSLAYENFICLMVDNGSEDDSVQYIRESFPEVHVIENGKNLGYANGMNIGMKYAFEQGAEYFLIMNNDTVIDQHALSELVNTAQSHEEAGFVTGKVYFMEQPDVLQTVGKKEDRIHWSGDHIGYCEKDVGQYDVETERAFCDDVYVLVKRDLYETVGGLNDQYFLQSAEFDWQVRAKKRGWTVYYTPRARLWHHVGKTMGGRENSISRYFDLQARIVAMALNAKFPRFLVFYFWAAWSTSTSLAKGALRLDWQVIKPRLARFLGFIGGTFWLLHRRPVRKIPRIIKILR